MGEFLKKITFKHVSILLLFVVFLYLLFRNKNENLETEQCFIESQECRKTGDSDNCCKGLVCHQNECKPANSVKERTKLSSEDLSDLTRKFTSEVSNRGYYTAPNVEEKINESILESKIDSESEIDSKLDLDYDADADISKKMSSKLSRLCTCKCKCDDVNTTKNEVKDEDEDEVKDEVKNEPTDDFIRETIVKSSKGMGDYCTIDNECYSGKCSKESNSCVFKLDDEDCLAGSQCVSQKCDPNTKKCVTKDLGVKCTFGNQCKSGNCSSKVNCNADIPGDCDAICLEL